MTRGRWPEYEAWAEAQGTATVVCLVPARTDTRWSHEYAIRGELRFLRGRVRFVGARYGAPFPSAVVIFRAQQKLGLEVYGANAKAPT